MSGQHVCKALAVHCIDFRIQRFLNEYLDKKFPAAYDRVAVPGGVKYLVDGGEAGNYELEECMVSYKLHHPEVFVLIQHEDCGAYGGSKALGDFATEKVFQEDQLRKAEQLVQKHFPGITVKKLLVRLSGALIPTV
ncbi:MAG: hypothetical protein HYT49_03835 [Candidatus Wildermuthbacteria bacterium]|nr:hypothetical protein [Candidatus Wildermuthbacteria bacterium]